MTRISGLNYECRYEESARCIAAAVRGHELPYLTQTLRSDGKRSAKAAQIHLKRRWLLTIAFRGGCLQILNFIDSKNRRLSSLWFLRPMLYPVLGQECIKLIRRSGFDVI